MTWYGSKRNLTQMGLEEAKAIYALFRMRKDASGFVPDENVIRQSVRWDTREIRFRTLSREFNDENPERPFWRITFQYLDDRDSWIWSVREARYNDGKFTIEIAYQPGFPKVEPWVTLTSHDIGEVRHRFLQQRNGQYVICLHAHNDDPTTEWNPGQWERGPDGRDVYVRSTAATLGSWTVQWIRSWLRWKWNDGRSWPEP